MIKIISFSSSFSNSGEDGVPTMGLGHVIDQFLNQDSFSNSGPSEKSDLTTSSIRGEQVDDFNTSNKQFGSRTLFLKAGGISMNRIIFFSFDRSSFINGFSDDVHDTAQGFRSYGDFNRGSKIIHGLASYESVGRIQCNGSHTRVAQMLGHFENKFIVSSFHL